MTTVKRAASWAVLAALLLAVAGSLVLWQQGYRLYAVRTGSMAPTYPVGALVVDAPPRRDVTPGEVVTFRTRGGLVTHRVAQAAPAGLTTKGDANRTADAWTVAPQSVVGVVRAGAAGGGYLLVFLQQPSGAASLVLLAASVLLAWSLFFPGRDAAAA